MPVLDEIEIKDKTVDKVDSLFDNDYPASFSEAAEMSGLELFQQAIDLTDNLEIIDYELHEDKSDILIVENSALDKDAEGHQVVVEVDHILERVTSPERALQFIDVINGKRNSIVCEGVTRIVGYYSRTHNWNKSKIGELRDRMHGNYSVGAGRTLPTHERINSINNMI